MRCEVSAWRLCEDSECSSPSARPGVSLGGTTRLGCPEGAGNGPVHELDFSITPGPSFPGEESTAGSLPTVCPSGSGLSLATSAPGQMHPRKILEPVEDTSLEMPTTASPGLSSGFPWQPSLPMVHADSRGPGYGGRRGGLAGQSRQLVEGASLKDLW